MELDHERLLGNEPERKAQRLRDAVDEKTSHRNRHADRDRSSEQLAVVRHQL